MTHTDAKQQRLRFLYAELRRVKQDSAQSPDPFAEVYRQERMREEIKKIEDQIEREMDDG